MIFKLNNKGFTMVELLVAMAIMGLLIIMAFPTIRAIQTNNNNTKYEEYGKSAISATKLYVDSYGEDLFTDDVDNQFKSVTFEELIKKDLLKDINISDSSCIKQSKVTIVKYKNDYAYCLDLKCTAKGSEYSNKYVYKEKNRKGSCQNFVELKITYSYKGVQHSFDVIKGDVHTVLSPEQAGFNLNADHVYLDHWNSNVGEKKKGDVITVNENIIFSASVQPFQYIVKYKSGLSGTSGTMRDKTCTYGTSCKLDKNNYSKNCYIFNNWSYGGLTIADETDMQTLINQGKISITSHRQPIDLTGSFRITKLKIRYNSNGGTLINPHASSITRSGNKILYNNNEVHHNLNCDGQLSTDGLSNYNNPGWINLQFSGYSITNKKEWNTKNNGSGSSFDQTVRYTAQQLCPTVISKDCDLTMYANWNMNKPTCAITANTAVPASGWYSGNVGITMNTTGILSQYGLDRVQNSTNSKKTLTATAEGNIPYYGFVKNAGGSNSCSISLKIDKTPPTASIQISSKSGSYNTNQVNVTIKAKDTLSGINKYCLTKGSSCTPNSALSGAGSINSEKTTTTQYTMSGSYNGSSSKLTVCVSDMAGKTNCAQSNTYSVYRQCSQVVNDGSSYCGAYGSCVSGYKYADRIQKRKDRFTGASCGNQVQANGCQVSCCTYPMVNSYMIRNTGTGLRCFMGSQWDVHHYDGAATYELTECYDGLSGWICMHMTNNPYTECFGKMSYREDWHGGNGYGHLGFTSRKWQYIRSNGQSWAYMCNSSGQCITYHDKYPYI